MTRSLDLMAVGLFVPRSPPKPRPRPSMPTATIATSARSMSTFSASPTLRPGDYRRAAAQVVVTQCDAGDVNGRSRSPKISLRNKFTLPRG